MLGGVREQLYGRATKRVVAKRQYPGPSTVPKRATREGIEFASFSTSPFLANIKNVPPDGRMDLNAI